MPTSLFLPASWRSQFRWSRLLGVVAAAIALASGADPATKPFDLPADTAEKSLKKFSTQAGLEVLFATEATAGIKTNAVKGNFAPRDAIDRLLAGTALVATQDAKTGALVVAHAEPAKPSAPPEKNVVRRSLQNATPADADKVFTLEAVSVTGTNVRRIDQEHALPVSVVTSEFMEARNAATPVELLASLPQTRA